MGPIYLSPSAFLELSIRSQIFCNKLLKEEKEKAVDDPRKFTCVFMNLKLLAVVCITFSTTF